MRSRGVNPQTFIFKRTIINLKNNELEAQAKRFSPDIIAVTESWTNDSHTDAYLAINNYSLILRQDRLGRGGDGILLYAKNNITGQIMPDQVISVTVFLTNMFNAQTSLASFSASRRSTKVQKVQ